MGEERLEPGGRIGWDGPGQPDPGPSGGAGERPQDADAPFLRLDDYKLYGLLDKSIPTKEILDKVWDPVLQGK